MDSVIICYLSVFLVCIAWMVESSISAHQKTMHSLLKAQDRSIDILERQIEIRIDEFDVLRKHTDHLLTQVAMTQVEYEMLQEKNTELTQQLQQRRPVGRPRTKHLESSSIREKKMR